MNSTTNRTAGNSQSVCLETARDYSGSFSLLQNNYSSSSENARVNHSSPEISDKQNIRRHRNIQKVIRKLEGYLSYIEEDEAVVCFIDKGREVEMIVPARQLIQNGIRREGQPFEFKESEEYNRDSGLWETIFSYSPLCRENECTREMLPLSSDMKEKLYGLLNKNAEN